MQRKALWILLIGLVLGMLIVTARNQTGALAALTSHDFASIAIKIFALVFAGALVMTLFRERFAKALEAALLWVVVAVVLLLGYTFRFELRDIGDQALSELVPGRAAARGRLVQLARGGGGDFQVSTEVNGKHVPMVLDSGASTVVLTNEAAKAAGLPLEMVKYSVNIDTANGRTHAAAVTLERIAIGGIIEKSVPALIAQPGQLKTSLLGMSFLNRLQSWEVRGDRLLLRGYP
jgi:aspartyl protease family protein